MEDKKQDQIANKAEKIKKKDNGDIESIILADGTKYVILEKSKK